VEDPEWRLFRTVWKSAEYPRSAAWLASQREALVEIRKLSKKERFYIPYLATQGAMFDIETQTPVLTKMRGMANLLMTDAMRCVGEGDGAGFCEDVEATLRLARLCGQGPTLIEYLVSVAIEATATEGMRIGAERAGFLTAAQARGLLRMVDEVPPAAGIDRSIDTAERWYALDGICGMAAQGRLAGVGSERGKGIAFVPIHFNEVLRAFNTHFDRMVEAFRMRSYPEQQAALKVIEKDLQDRGNVGMASKVTHPTQAVTTLLLQILMPALSRVGEFQELRAMNMDLVRAALALRVYRMERGAFPEGLGALAPSILKEVPVDGFVERALVYRREGNGYVMYSVGPNCVDDGGVERGKATRRNYDLVVRGE
jgi:hypothetical protein